MNELIRMETIASNIRQLRLEQSLTQAELGEMLGYSTRQIRRLETEGTASLEVVNLLAMAFQVPAEDILFR